MCPHTSSNPGGDGVVEVIDGDPEDDDDDDEDEFSDDEEEKDEAIIIRCDAIVGRIADSDDSNKGIELLLNVLQDIVENPSVEKYQTLKKKKVQRLHKFDASVIELLEFAGFIAYDEELEFIPRKRQFKLAAIAIEALQLSLIHI